MTASGWHRKRVTPAERQRRIDYNSREHREARAAGVKQVAAGIAHCWRCGRFIAPGTAWHVGHDQHRRIRGTEHARCNLHAAAQDGARIANAQRQATRRRQLPSW